MNSNQEEQLWAQEPTAMEVIDGLVGMLGREPTREEIVTALGVPLVYKEAQNFGVESFIAPYLKTQGKEKVDSLVEKVVPVGEDMLLGEMFACFAQWHVDRNLIEGGTDDAQFVKLLEEVVELYMTLQGPKVSAVNAVSRMQCMLQDMWRNGRIKVSTQESIADDVGDINVVLMNFIARHELTMGTCLMKSWGDIKDRKGRMVDGQFIKESDLEQE